MTGAPNDEPLALPSPCVVVLVGPVASGKSTWAKQWFEPAQIVSSDALRALVGESEHDLAASTDAFALLDDVVDPPAPAPAHDRHRHARSRCRPTPTVA